MVSIEFWDLCISDRLFFINQYDILQYIIILQLWTYIIWVFFVIFCIKVHWKYREKWIICYGSNYIFTACNCGPIIFMFFCDWVLFPINWIMLCRDRIMFFSDWVNYVSLWLGYIIIKELGLLYRDMVLLYRE